jgi:hypothetical protein
VTELKPPLWLAIAIGPSSAGTSTNIVEKLAITPLPKLRRPCVFGPNDAHPLCARPFGHAALDLAAFLSGFAESRCNDDRRLDAPLGAFVDRGNRRVAADDHERKLGHFGSAASDGYPRKPWISVRFGLIG